MATLSTPESAGSTSYVITAIDKWGRFADATPTRTMQWPPGTRISFTPHLAAGFIVIKAGGAEHVTSQGHLRLPLHLRHRLAVHAGDRLLLAIMPQLGMVTAYPISTVDAMVHALHATAAQIEATK
jgi:hypothetical protein